LIWRKIQVMKVLNVQFFSFFRYFLLY
jgi:hypothetical protein